MDEEIKDRLSKKEYEVFRCLGNGGCASQISNNKNISTKTIHNQIDSIKKNPKIAVLVVV